VINRIDDEEEAVERPFDGTMFVRLLTYVLPYKRLLAIAIVVLFIGTFTSLAIPYLTKVAIDQDILPGHWRGLEVLAGVLAGVYAVRYGAYRIQTFNISRLGEEMLRDLRSQLFHHIHTDKVDKTTNTKEQTRVLNLD